MRYSKKTTSKKEADIKKILQINRKSKVKKAEAAFFSKIV
jgi:hypothetical protein